MLASWWLAWHFQDEFISDWDGLDYTAYTIQGLPSALGLGRSLFLGYNHLLWKLAQKWLDTPPENAYLILRYGVISLAGPTVVAIYALFKELSESRLSALFGASILAASPYFIIYSGRAMSEIPGFLMLAAAFWLMLRSLRSGSTYGFLLAAFFAGLSANIREFVVFYLPFIPISAWIIGRSWRKGLGGTLLAILGAVGGIIFWTIYAPEKYWPATIEWYLLSAQERTIHPIGPENLAFLVDFSYNCSVATTLLAPLAIIWLWQYRERRLLHVFGLLGLLANLVLIINHDLSVNPRYMLTGLLGLAAICGWVLAEMVRFRGVWAAMVIVGLIVLTKGSYNNMSRELYNQEWAARESRNYFSKLGDMPWNSAFIVGSRTPLINFYAVIGARPYWKAIPIGSAWPDDKLDEAIDDLLIAGRLVYIDFDAEIWQAGQRKENREAPGLEMIKRDYEFEYLRESMYRVLGKKNPPSSMQE